MTDQLLLLVQLQEISSQRNRYQEQERAFAQKLKSAEQTLEQAKAALEQWQAQKKQLGKKKHEKELELKIHEDNITKIKERMTKLKTNEEYHAHIKEIETAQAKKGEYEETVLILFEEEDRLNKEKASLEKNVSEANQQFEQCQQEINKERAHLSEAAQSLDVQWTALCEKMDKPILDQYNDLLGRYKGLAVVPFSGTTCTGCHYNIPPQRIAEVKAGDKILTCTYCHRILYAPVKTG